MTSRTNPISWLQDTTPFRPSPWSYRRHRENYYADDDQIIAIRSDFPSASAAQEVDHILVKWEVTDIQTEPKAHQLAQGAGHQSSHRFLTFNFRSRTHQTIDLALARALWRNTFSRVAIVNLGTDDSGTAVSDRFSPSPVLLQLVADGLREYQELSHGQVAHVSEDELSTAQVSGRLKEAFVAKLEQMFATLGSRRRDGIDGPSDVSRAGEFTLEYQLAILDRIPIKPLDDTEFLTRLLHELKSFIWRGGRISGDWGSLIVDVNGELRLAISPPAVDDEEHWEEAIVTRE